MFSVPDECSFSVVLDRMLSWASLLKITGHLEAFEGAIRGGGVAFNIEQHENSTS